MEFRHGLSFRSLEPLETEKVEISRRKRERKKEREMKVGRSGRGFIGRGLNED